MTKKILRGITETFVGKKHGGRFLAPLSNLFEPCRTAYCQTIAKANCETETLRSTQHTRTLATGHAVN